MLQDGRLTRLTFCTGPAFVDVMSHPESIITEHGELILRNFRDPSFRPIEASVTIW